MIGVGVATFVGLFLFFMRQADMLAPQPRETRIDLPDAFEGGAIKGDALKDRGS